MPSLSDGVRALATLRTELEKVGTVQQNVALAILAQARRNAARRPTPQARMVASGMVVTRANGVVIGFGSRRVFGRGSPGGVRMGLIAFGSEFGSTHRQFGAPWQGGAGSGYWLHPAAEGRNPKIDEEQERHADEAIDAAIRSAGP